MTPRGKTQNVPKLTHCAGNPLHTPLGQSADNSQAAKREEKTGEGRRQEGLSGGHLRGRRGPSARVRTIPAVGKLPNAMQCTFATGTTSKFLD